MTAGLQTAGRITSRNKFELLTPQPLSSSEAERGDFYFWLNTRGSSRFAGQPLATILYPSGVSKMRYAHRDCVRDLQATARPGESEA